MTRGKVPQSVSGGLMLTYKGGIFLRFIHVRGGGQAAKLLRRSNQPSPRNGGSVHLCHIKDPGLFGKGERVIDI
jgi:hypothetical protein